MWTEGYLPYHGQDYSYKFKGETEQDGAGWRDIIVYDKACMFTGIGGNIFFFFFY